MCQNWASPVTKTEKWIAFPNCTCRIWKSIRVFRGHLNQGRKTEQIVQLFLTALTENLRWMDTLKWTMSAIGSWNHFLLIGLVISAAFKNYWNNLSRTCGTFWNNIGGHSFPIPRHWGDERLGAVSLCIPPSQKYKKRKMKLWKQWSHPCSPNSWCFSPWSNM